MNSLSKIDKFSYFYHPSPFECDIIFKESLFECAYQIMKQVALEGFLKKHRDVSRTIATAKMELFVALVSSLQPLINFKKEPQYRCYGSPKYTYRILKRILKFVEMIKLSIPEL